MKTVSILTITQYKRFQSFQLLVEMVCQQDYHHILEWIIVEGSPTMEYANKNELQINDYFSSIENNTVKMDIPSIKYIQYSGKNLGGLRNLANQYAKGEILVCFDDDDYYPPERISHAVEKLMNSTCLIGGVSSIYMYDFEFDSLYQFDSFGQNHSTNNAMAYKKEYVKNHLHDENATSGEELLFTNRFCEPMVQFDPYKTIIVNSHFENTVSKKSFCLAVAENKIHYVKKIDLPITEYIPFDMYQKMQRLYFRK